MMKHLSSALLILTASLLVTGCEPAQSEQEKKQASKEALWKKSHDIATESRFKPTKNPLDWTALNQKSTDKSSDNKKQ